MPSATPTRTSAHRRALLITGLLVGLWGLLALVWYFWGSATLLDRFEWRTVDWRFVRRGSLTPSDRIAIVEVDEESIRTVGRWPWPREKYARLIEKLTSLGASRIVFDIFFAEGEASDEALASATRRAGNTYHAAFIYTPTAGQAPPPSPEVAARAWRSPIVRPRGLSAVADLIEPPGVTFPLPRLVAAARGFGLANVLDSGDGVYRHLVPLVRYQGATYPSVALAVASDWLNLTPSQVRIIPGQCIELGAERRVPLDVHGRQLINFVGSPGTAYPYLSAGAVLRGEAAADKVRGRIVLVGVTAPGIYDLRASPFRTNFNGVESEANALDNLLTGRFLRELPPLLTAAALVLVTILFGLLLPRLPTWLLCTVSLGALLGYPSLASWLFSSRSLVVNLVYPMATMAGGLVIILVTRLLLEERRRFLAQTALRHFVPPQLVSHLVEEEALTTMRGERRDISVFFADIRNFTAISEELAPEDTVLFLNQYFALMLEVIFEHGGTLDKYIGDEIMGFFNAPLSQADHARLAVRTAIDMQRHIAANQAEWEYLQVPALSAGIGIATGPAVVGYLGSGRMQYTVIGRTVNLASRLQALCRQLHCRILVSDATYQAVSDLVEAEDLGEMPIPGLTQPVRVWHLLDYRHEEDRGHWPPVDAPIAAGGAAGTAAPET